MIVKIQRSVFPDDSSLLVYNEDRSVLLEVPVESAPPSLRLAKGTKAFFYAELNNDVRLVVGKEVEEQPW
jgi:hypothetical protein